jgi:hypothetical protein
MKDEVGPNLIKLLGTYLVNWLCKISENEFLKIYYIVTRLILYKGSKIVLNFSF